MDQTRFEQEVRARIGPDDADGFANVVQATVAALGALVGHPHRQTIADALPDSLARPFRDAHYDPSMGREAFVAQVASSEHVPAGRALEHATAVLSALAASLEEDARHVLEAELPEDVREWVRPKRESRPTPRAPSHFPVEPPHHHSDRHAHRLSDGRAGSRHAISEGVPRDMHGDSVAARPDPHAETKLGSARGLTQEREHETLAEGADRSERPLSETD